MRNLIEKLDLTIAERLRNPTSYPSSNTVILAAGGVEAVAYKLGEEVAETIQACLVETDEALLGEAQQVLYVEAVGLAMKGLAFSRAFDLSQKSSKPQLNTQNDVVKNLGREAGMFTAKLCGACEPQELIIVGGGLVCAIARIVEYRGLSIEAVLERI